MLDKGSPNLPKAIGVPQAPQPKCLTSHISPFGRRLTQKETPNGLTLKLVRSSSPPMSAPTQYPKQIVQNRSLLTQPTSASHVEHSPCWGEVWTGPSPWSPFSRWREDRVTGITPSCCWGSGPTAQYPWGMQVETVVSYTFSV